MDRTDATSSPSPVIALPDSSDWRGIDEYLSQMEGAKFIQPPQPAGYWEARCDEPRCCRGTVTMYDMHGSYDASCSKCGGTGVLNAERLRRWLEKKENPYGLD